MMSHRTCKGIVSLSFLFVVAACSPGGDDSQTESNSEAESPSTTTTALGSEEVAESELDNRIHDVTQRREAAWEARMEGFTSRDPFLPSLHETYTDVALFSVVSSGPTYDGILSFDWMRYDYLDWNVDVQSVAFPSEDIAILETCIDYTYNAFNQDNEDLSEIDTFVDIWRLGVPLLANHTDIMWREDGSWKLALSLSNRANSGDKSETECRISEGEPQLSNDEIQSVLDDANTAYFQSLQTNHKEELSDFFTGEMLPHYVEATPHYEGYFAIQCPQYPNVDVEVSTKFDEVPNFIDTMYEEFYGVAYSEDNEYRQHISGREHSQPASVLDCANEVRPAFSPVAAEPEAEDIFFGERSNFSVNVIDVTYPTESQNVVYVDVCREHTLEVLDTHKHVDKTFIDERTIHSTDSLAYVDGAWKVSTRWDIEAEEGLHC